MTVVYNNRFRGIDVHYYDGSGNPCHPAKVDDSAEVDPLSTGDGFVNGTTVCDLIQDGVVLLGIVQTGTARSNVPFDDSATTNPSFHMPRGDCPRS